MDRAAIICSLEEIVFGSSNSGGFRSAVKFKCDGRTDRYDIVVVVASHDRSGAERKDGKSFPSPAHLSKRFFIGPPDMYPR